MPKLFSLIQVFGGFGSMGRQIRTKHANSSPYETFMCSVLDALVEGREQALIDAVHDEVEWRVAVTQRGYFPFGGAYRGKSGVEDWLSQFSKRCVFRQFDPHEVISSGEVIWGLFSVRVEFVEEPSPRDLTSRIAIRWRMQENKIIEHEAFMDTLPLLFPQNARQSV